MTDSETEGGGREPRRETGMHLGRQMEKAENHRVGESEPGRTLAGRWKRSPKALGDSKALISWGLTSASDEQRHVCEGRVMQRITSRSPSG